MAEEMQKLSIPDLVSMKREGKKISMITAYSYPQGLLVDEAGIDIILVGDSLGMVELGYSGTTPVTMEEMLAHIKPVTRAVKRAHVVGDMPFMSYNVSIEQAITNAGILYKEGACDSIKLEGGQEMAKTIEAIIRAGIPTFGHIGLTPQTAGMLGGFKVQGKSLDAAKKLIDDAIILGLFKRFTPKFVKVYANAWDYELKAIKDFIDEVKEQKFPTDEFTYTMKEDVLNELSKYAGV